MNRFEVAEKISDALGSSPGIQCIREKSSDPLTLVVVTDDDTFEVTVAYASKPVPVGTCALCGKSMEGAPFRYHDGCPE